MDERSAVLLVICNVPDSACAKTIAESLLSRQLAACINVLAPVQSYYRWQGKIEHAEEATLLIKTTTLLYNAVETTVRDLHPYELPEIIALPITAGLPAYLDWVQSETRRDVE